MIDPDLVEIALNRVSGSQFEKFVNAFFPQIVGADYVPLGGIHDGGADGFGESVHERVGRAGTFYQASVQADVPAKIRHTARRLREVGREPATLILISSRTVPRMDQLEDDLTTELGMIIRIRDANYIRSQINHDAKTIFAFEKYLRPETEFLKSVGAASVLTGSKHVSSPAVYVYLRQAIDARQGDLSLANSVTDALALWALEGTDPDKNILLGAAEIEEKIVSEVPSAAPIIGGRVHKRLVRMARKSYPGGRKVNWHRKSDQFVLPYESRTAIAAQNKDDEALRLRVLQGLRDRVLPIIEESESGLGLPDEVAEISLRALQIAFEMEGLEFSRFITGERNVGHPQIGDAVRQAIAERNITGAQSVQYAEHCLAAVRDCLYHSSEYESEYLGRLARTYALLFTLSNEPRLVEYFEQMAADFYLYVGSDLLVRALSERYLPAGSQLVRNALLMAAKGGAQLILTEPVLDEVVGNLRASDREFRNHVEAVEHRMTKEMMREVPKILLRAYLYNRDGEGPSNWPGFVQQFCNHADLHSGEAQAQLRIYLQATFGMDYKTRDELETLVDPSEVDSLASALMQSKPSSELASNDALLACAVYGHRVRSRESSEASEFGYRTWWFTNETNIMHHSRDLVRRHGARYMMRPDFLLNYFAFAPKAAEVRQSFGRIFPSTLGLQMSRQMDEAVFHDMMAKVREAESYEEGRRKAEMSRCSDLLKSDFDRRYRVEVGELDDRTGGVAVP